MYVRSILNMLHTLCSSLQNAVYFIMLPFLVPVLFTFLFPVLFTFLFPVLFTFLFPVLFTFYILKKKSPWS